MKITANGIHIHVEDEGSGTPALVFLHYWGGSSRTWAPVMAHLNGRYRTVALDQRGWGRSDAPADGYRIADHADDAAGVIGALGLTRYVLVGHSMGGKAAQLLASRRPQGLAGLVLVAPSPPAPMAIPAEQRDAIRHVYESRESIAAARDHVLTARPLSAALQEQVVEDSLRGAAQAKAAWPTVGMLEDITREVASIDVPTLVIAGERDQVETPDTLRRELLPRIAHAVLHVLPKTGHLSPLEAPAEIADMVRAFVDRRIEASAR
ncbi:alpha/beta fold hydrolase [Trinickia terrae]|uniref:Alpha/beta fold hydrolase n=1 Tax=Trinickia terrae TaxID=2571161 RepID=A0A4U1I736_9BURK|nr:alpha/beta hydrolase [Trinickia terrae]TKC89214.1 alpha/beta fold hydrolase [Trinickia terrae]